MAARPFSMFRHHVSSMALRKEPLWMAFTREEVTSQTITLVPTWLIGDSPVLSARTLAASFPSQWCIGHPTREALVAPTRYVPSLLRVSYSISLFSEAWMNRNFPWPREPMPPAPSLLNPNDSNRAQRSLSGAS